MDALLTFLSSCNLFSCASSLLVGLVCVVWFANVYSPPERPRVVYKKVKDGTSGVAEKVATRCNILMEKYFPPLLWGRSGHLQAHMYGFICRFFPPQVNGQRHRRVAADGATITFDVFYPQLSTNCESNDETRRIAVVIPGIGNGSDRPYVRVLVREMNRLGYIVSVLNHLGALEDEMLTSRRIFTYGGTDDFQLMMDWVLERWPGSMVIGVGLSMGGNVLMKYLGEKPNRQRHFVGAVSVCQGYNIAKGLPTLMNWAGLRRLYNYHVTKHLRKVVRRHSDVLFVPPVERRDDSSTGCCLIPDMERTLSATSLMEIDTHLQRHLVKFNSLEEYYEQDSCCHYLHNITDVPVLLVNAQDDPLVAEFLLETAEDYASTFSNALFVLTKHGSHLAFFEGGILIPNTVTWIDRMITQFMKAADEIHREI